MAVERTIRWRPACALLLALALAACSTTSMNGAAAPESEDALYATSPANIASLTDVVQRNPNDPQAYNMRGAVLGQAGRFDEALADFNKAIGIDPNYAQAYANRGLVYRETGKYDLALADYNKAISIDPSYAVGLSRPRHGLPRAEEEFSGVAGFQQGDRHPARQRAGLLQPRPALSEPAPARLRHRRFHHRHRAVDATGRAICGARLELSRGEQRQERGERPRRRGHHRSAERAGLGEPRARL